MRPSPGEFSQSRRAFLSLWPLIKESLPLEVSVQTVIQSFFPNVLVSQTVSVQRPPAYVGIFPQSSSQQASPVFL